jgi:hypothetical protein
MGALFPSNDGDRVAGQATTDDHALSDERSAVTWLPSARVPGDHDAVSPEQMLEELERLARRVGLEVRFESFDPKATRPGGLCTLRGSPLVLVDAHAPTVDKVAVLCGALSCFDIEVLYVPPVLRARIHRGTLG